MEIKNDLIKKRIEEASIYCCEHHWKSVYTSNGCGIMCVECGIMLFDKLLQPQINNIMKQIESHKAVLKV